MTQRYLWLLGGVAAAAVILGVVLWPDGPREAAPDQDRLYRLLLASDPSDLAAREGLDFTGISGMLPPEEAERERHWLVYAGFEGPADRHRIGYQITTPRQLEDLEDPVEALGRCQHDDLGWECFDSVDGVFVQGEATCLSLRCVATRRHAETLLRLGIRHLHRTLAT
ncbi:MAG: hypothetical protein M3134_08760 [Actinomycetota bacterium]|nr:hypothetical protein [Actinomycetota bacterium]